MHLFLPLSQEIMNSSIFQLRIPCNFPNIACFLSVVLTLSSGKRIVSAIRSARPGNVLKYTVHRICKFLALKICTKWGRKTFLKFPIWNSLQAHNFLSLEFWISQPHLTKTVNHNPICKRCSSIDPLTVTPVAKLLQGKRLTEKIWICQSN